LVGVGTPAATAGKPGPEAAGLVSAALKNGLIAGAFLVVLLELMVEAMILHG
jgi:hypothetical protein